MLIAFSSDVVGDRAGAEGLDEQADRVGGADRVGDLHLAAPGQAGGDDVLGHPAHRVGAGAVDLRRVLAGEGAAAVAGHAAVGVDDDLAAGQPGVAHGAADDELAGRVDQQPVAVGGQAEGGQLGLDDELLDVGGEQLLDRDVLGVLRGDDDGVDGDRPVVLVDDGDLGLAVGAQVGHRAVLADRRQPAGQAVGQRDRQRHELGGLVGGVAEHQALVAGALALDLVLGGAGGARPRSRCRRPGRCRATARRWRR